jgi:hypothetical protein
MVDSLKNTTLPKEKRLQSYLCAAGVLAHYIGDACQPLHVSYLHHGLPNDKSDDKVHAVYEDDMLDHARPELVAGVAKRLKGQSVRKHLQDAAAAADAVVQLMQRTIKNLPPSEVLEVYNRVRGNKQSDAMWSELGERTMDCIADGVVTLAAVWQSAWKEGGGDDGEFDSALLKSPMDTDALKELYENKSFAESKWLHEM